MTKGGSEMKKSCHSIFLYIDPRTLSSTHSRMTVIHFCHSGRVLVMRERNQGNNNYTYLFISHNGSTNAIKYAFEDDKVFLMQELKATFNTTKYLSHKPPLYNSSNYFHFVNIIFSNYKCKSCTQP